MINNLKKKLTKLKKNLTNVLWCCKSMKNQTREFL